MDFQKRNFLPFDARFFLFQEHISLSEEMRNFNGPKESIEKIRCIWKRTCRLCPIVFLLGNSFCFSRLPFLYLFFFVSTLSKIGDKIATSGVYIDRIVLGVSFNLFLYVRRGVGGFFHVDRWGW